MAICLTEFADRSARNANCISRRQLSRLGEATIDSAADPVTITRGSDGALDVGP